MVQGLFNLLPNSIRNLTGVSVDNVKDELDAFPNQIPDEPQIIGYTAMPRADSNSPTDIVKARPFFFKGLAHECRSLKIFPLKVINRISIGRP